jgi:hypothetical protein
MIASLAEPAMIMIIFSLALLAGDPAFRHRAVRRLPMSACA